MTEWCRCILEVKWIAIVAYVKDFEALHIIGFTSCLVSSRGAVHGGNFA